MINIKIKRKNRRVTVNVTGHASSAPHGEDLVCAAVSTLVLTLCNTLARGNAREFKYRLCDGEANITFLQDKKTKPYMHTVLCGFDFLGEMYPQFIKLEVNG